MLLDVLKGIGYLFINPIFYLFLFMAIWIGVKRVKRERDHFHIRVFDVFQELRTLFYPGVLMGLLFSSLTIGLGFVLPVGAIMLLVSCMVVLLLTFQIRLLSPAYVFGLCLLLSALIPIVHVDVSLLTSWTADIQATPLFAWSVLLSLFLLVEGLFIWKKGSLQTVPLLNQSKRGKKIGMHEAKYVWMIPTFLLIPGGQITSIFEWWPVVGIAGHAYGLIVFPFGIGLHRKVQSILPERALRQTGRHVSWLGFIVTLVTVMAYWWPVLALVAAAIAVLGREWICYKERVLDDQNSSFFSARDKGIVILGIIPDSPAEKMNLKIGEIIVKVNGLPIHHDSGLYEALQNNRTYCKIEVIDHTGELRFAQCALYEKEHHQLGVLSVTDHSERTSEVG